MTHSHSLSDTVPDGRRLSFSVAPFAAARAAPRTQFGIAFAAAEGSRREGFNDHLLGGLPQILAVHLLEHSPCSFDFLTRGSDDYNKDIYS